MLRPSSPGVQVNRIFLPSFLPSFFLALYSPGQKQKKAGSSPAFFVLPIPISAHAYIFNANVFFLINDVI
jgi:hypothetical protein